MAVVTIDAAAGQRAIVQAAVADYVLAVKRKQRTLHAVVRAAFEEAARGIFTPPAQDRCGTVERAGGCRRKLICPWMQFGHSTGVKQYRYPTVRVAAILWRVQDQVQPELPGRGKPLRNPSICS